MSSQVFFKHFASKHQLPGFYIIRTLVENRFKQISHPEELTTVRTREEDIFQEPCICQFTGLSCLM